MVSLERSNTIKREWSRGSKGVCAISSRGSEYSNWLIRMSGTEEADDQVEDDSENNADQKHGHYGEVNGQVAHVEYSIAGETTQTGQTAEADEKQTEEDQKATRYQ